MDAGEFERGAKRAESRLDQFGKRVGLTGDQIRTGLLAMGAAAGAAATAIAAAVRSMINDFDKLAKDSQRIGVPVEQLSALGFAAELSGVKMESLVRAFRNVARNAQAAVRGPTDFTRALDQLNIEFLELDGSFKRADLVLIEAAEQLSKMEDGANKTALAMKIFGERAGPELVPLLNMGRAGLEAIKKEAIDYGIVVSTKTARQAEVFNDTMLRLSKVWQGFITQLTTEALPVLIEVADFFKDMAADSGAASSSVKAIVQVFKSLASVLIVVTSAFDELAGWIITLGAATNRVIRGKFVEAWELVQAQVDMTQARIEETAKRIQNIWGETADKVIEEQDRIRRSSEGALVVDVPATQMEDAPVPELKPLGDAMMMRAPTPELKPLLEFNDLIEKQSGLLEMLAERQRAHNEQVQFGRFLAESLQTPNERMLMEMEALRVAHEQGAISSEKFGRAMQHSAFVAVNAYAQMASFIANSLAIVFKDSKAVAIATALINTFEAVTKALAAFPPPFNFAAAAAVLAAGLAQVANIKSTTERSSGAGGAGGGASLGAAAAGPTSTVVVEGLTADRILSGATVGPLIERLLEAQADGAQVVLAR